MEDKKILLSIRDLVVKFRVRGRILTAIRGISLDIYENESIAIVGESGSGKSVFTKTFAGMLDENGFIDQGSIQFFDDTLSDTTVSYGHRIMGRIRRTANKLNRACLARAIELKQADEEAKKLAEEEIKLPDETYETNREIAREIALYTEGDAFFKRWKKTREIIKGLTEEIKNDADIADSAVRDKYYQMSDDLDWRKIKRYSRRLDRMSTVEAGSEIYRQMRDLDNEKRDKGRLSEEDYGVFQKKIDDINFRKTESYNYRLTLDTKKQKAEVVRVDAQIKGFEAELKKAQAELKEAKKAKKAELAADTAYLSAWQTRKNKLKAEYSEAISNAVIDDEMRKRNRMLAREIVLSVGRFPIIRRIKCTRRLFKALKNAKQEGINLDSAEEREKIYRDITFRVEYRSEDSIGFHGFSMIDLSKVNYSGDWMKVRGERIATVFQDPMTSLNPIITIGKQITSVILRHQGCSEAEARKRALILMKKVGIPNAEKRFDDYPFQYSGGMRQRIVIAIALSCQPKILICDEPTTALDVTIQAQILRLIKDLQKEFGYTIVFITHDLGVVANVADRVAVLYAGQIVELGKVEEVFYDPRHPYTWALLSSLPQLAQRNTKLFSIQGTPPSLYNKIIGDPFAPRNQYCMKIDTLVEPPYFSVSETHIAKTWLLDPRSPKVEKPEAIDGIHEKLMKAFNI
jgi:oligopeptide/dipeptide ABC transporter, ATP-binding protein, C-terminal domain